MKLSIGLILLGVFLLAGCGFLFQGQDDAASQSALTGSFTSNGQKIYYTGTNKQGEHIPYEDGPGFSNTMMAQTLACASCHGTDGSGGEHLMHMDVMDAPDIRYTALASEDSEQGSNADGDGHGNAEYDLETFRMAVVLGQHPDGESLNKDMPRWVLNDQDLADLFVFIKTLH